MFLGIYKIYLTLFLFTVRKQEEIKNIYIYSKEYFVNPDPEHGVYELRNAQSKSERWCLAYCKSAIPGFFSLYSFHCLLSDKGITRCAPLRGSA